MGMISEIAIETTIRSIVEEIKKELEANKSRSTVCKSLKAVGRCALNQFEWESPDWSRPYFELFEYEKFAKRQKPRKNKSK